MTTRVSMGEPEERPEELAGYETNDRELAAFEEENEEVLDYEAPLPEPEEEVVREQDLSDDSPQFPDVEDGPTRGEIKRWKDVFTKLYVTTFPGDVKVVWRALRRDEYKQVMREMEALAQRPDVAPSEASFINEERIAEMAILFPEYVAGQNEENQLAGIVSLISQQVMEASGFVSTDIEEL